MGSLQKGIHCAPADHLTRCTHLKVQHKKVKNTTTSPGCAGSHQEAVMRRRICGENELQLEEGQNYPDFYKRFCQPAQSFLLGLIVIHGTEHWL